MRSPYTQQPKSFTLDGKRYKLDALVPAHEIEWKVMRMHVGTSDDKVKAVFRDTADPAKGWTERLIKQAENYALYCHRANQGTYRYVMGT